MEGFIKWPSRPFLWIFFPLKNIGIFKNIIVTSSNDLKKEITNCIINGSHIGHKIRTKISCKILLWILYIPNTKSFFIYNKHTLFSTFDKNKIYKFVEGYRKFRSRSSHSADSFFFFCKNVKSSNPTANLIPRPISLSSVISFHISHVAGLPTWRT